MRGKTKGVLLAYLPSALLVLVGFGVAELLRLAAAAMHEQWPATLATWLSLAALIAAIARAFWVSWRLWRPRGVAAVPPASGARPRSRRQRRWEFKVGACLCGMRAWSLQVLAARVRTQPSPTSAACLPRQTEG